MFKKAAPKIFWNFTIKHLLWRFCGSDTVIFLWILWNFSKQLIYRTRLNSCFWYKFIHGTVEIAWNVISNSYVKKIWHINKYFLWYVPYLKPATLLKKRLWRRCFPVTFVKILRTPLLQNTSSWCFWISSCFY